MAIIYSAQEKAVASVMKDLVDWILELVHHDHSDDITLTHISYYNAINRVVVKIMTSTKPRLRNCLLVTTRECLF